MKKWETPKAVEEQFTANSNVSVCYSVSCTLPGNSPYEQDGYDKSYIYESKVSDRASRHLIWGDQQFPKYSVFAEKHDGNCASPARYNAETGVFKESGINGSVLKGIKIDTTDPISDGKYPAIWTSHFLGVDYHHIGYAVDDSVGHPLRS